ncbi:MAG: hypothetical protein H5T44_02610 [Thermoplasmatales archaeon]|nr:hypothetical protein [Thermoplasmatales archaeon]
MKKLLIYLLLAFIFINFEAQSIEIGGFKVEDGKISGKYLPAGLEGKISCYKEDKKIIDMVYKNESIEVSIQFFDALEKIIERDPLLKEEIRKALVPINIKGAFFGFEYSGCVVELHDAPTRFLKIFSDRIVISEIYGYEINKINESLIKMRKGDMGVVLMSDRNIFFDGENITAQDNMILASFYYSEEKIEDAFLNKSIGGEIVIAGFDLNNETYSLSYFGEVSIEAINITQGRILLNVRGNSSSGKVIKINLGKNIFFSDEFTVKFDGKKIDEADSLEDILNPNDDGIYPEYYKLDSKEGVILLISIPHFSEYKVSIEFLIESLAGKIIILILSIFVISLAALYLFKK